MEANYEQALDSAKRFLGRWNDGVTLRMRDDLAQEAVVETWLREDSLRDPECLDAFVRTVARRKRYRALERMGRKHPANLDRCYRVAERVAEPDRSDEKMLRIEGEWIELSWLRPHLDAAIARLEPLNRELLLGFYAGISATELAERNGLSAGCVKARLHRCRRRLQRELSTRVRIARHSF